MNNSPEISTDTQFSIFLPNKPGILWKIVEQISASKNGLIAMCVVDATDHAIVRIVGRDRDRLRDVLKRFDFPTQETEVLKVAMPNKAGVITDVVERLADARINIHYAYVTKGPRGGTALGVFKLSNPAKATQVLSARTPKRKPATARKARAMTRR